MVYSHWNLSGSPFKTGIDPRQFYQSTSHEEALARLHFLVDQPRRIGLLLGESGVGKSLLLEVFAKQIRSATRQVVSLSLLGITPQDLLWQLATQFRRDVPQQESMFQLWRATSDGLVENRYQNISTVLLMDDADEAENDVLLQVARIAQSDPSTTAKLTIILTSQGRKLGRLGRRLLELADLRVDLEPWSEAETIAYLHWALAQAGCAKQIFTSAAKLQIHQLTEGVPRRVRQLADMALVAGAGSELDHIDVDVVDNVFQELGVAIVR
jgi:general secretion pathway protein A